MTMTTAKLTSQLTEALGSIVVDQVSEHAYRVMVPTGRMVHDWTSLAVERLGDEWVLSDGGQLRHLLAEDLTAVAELMRCAGAPFAVESGQIVARSTDEDLAHTVLSYVHHVVATPVVWQVRQCMEDDTSDARPISSTRQMARRTYEQLRSRLPSHHLPFVRLDARVAARGESTIAPLSVMREQRDLTPRMVASFVDLESTGQAIVASKRSTAFLLEVVRDRAIPKYVVVRGDDSAVDHMRTFWDDSNVSVIEEAAQEPLLDDAAEQIDALLTV